MKTKLLCISISIIITLLTFFYCEEEPYYPDPTPPTPFQWTSSISGEITIENDNDFINDWIVVELSSSSNFNRESIVYQLIQENLSSFSFEVGNGQYYLRAYISLYENDRLT